MELVRYKNGQSSVGSLLDQMFDKPWRNNFQDSNNGIPAANISEDKDNFYLEIAAPGLNKKDFNIELDNDQLRVSCNKEVTEEEVKFSRKEFTYHSFTRIFNLPDAADRNEIFAAYKSGILKVTVPKKEEAKEQPKRTIKVS